MNCKSALWAFTVIGLAPGTWAQSQLLTIDGDPSGRLFGHDLGHAGDKNGHDQLDLAVGAPRNSLGAGELEQETVVSLTDGSKLLQQSVGNGAVTKEMLVKPMPDYDGGGLAEFVTATQLS